MKLKDSGSEKSGRKPVEGSIFAPLPTEEKLLSDEQVLLSIYNEIKTEDDDKLKNPEYRRKEEEWNIRLTFIQEWFIRCSWINKFLFVEALCTSTTGSTVLENVLKSISSIFSKDVIESLLNDSPEFDYDRIPKDDNRALDELELKQAMTEASLWFVNLTPSLQTRVILRLLRLGGGGLIYKVYMSLRKLLENRRQQSKITMLSQTSSYTSHSTLDSKQKSRKSLPQQLSFMTENSELNEYTQEKLNQLARRNSELVKYRKLRGISNEESMILRKGETKETVDYLQILPIWLNRRILSYIDDKGLSGLKKVGKYWGKMIDESINEKSGRKAINAKINKIIGIKSLKEEKKEDETDKGEEEGKDFELIMKLDTKKLVLPEKGGQRGVVYSPEFYGVILSKKFKQTNLDTSLCRERCCAFDGVIGTLAASNNNNMIHFYSVRTAARFNFSVFGIEARVTCLALHQDRIHVVIGCRNGALIIKDIRTNKTTATFNGHATAVISLFTTSSNLLSASADNVIKCFQLWSGLCLLCVDLSQKFTISSFLLMGDNPLTFAMGTEDGVFVEVNIDAKRYVKRVKLHTEVITQLAHDGDILITGSSGGKVRVWSKSQLKNSFPVLKPYHNVNVGSSVSALTFYNNQIFAGCKNGTIQIISPLTGNVTKTMKISSQIPISGVKIYEDKVFMKLIIWHEGGIEMRTFSLQKSSPAKRPTGKDNRESKQEAPKETKKNKTSEMVLPGYVKNSRGLIEVIPDAYKRTTVLEGRIPLKDRACTLFTLRIPPEECKKFNTSVLTDVLNEEASATKEDFSFATFPRCQTNDGDKCKIN